MPIHAARIRAVSFDLDGTLIDTLPDLAGAVNETLTELGGVNLPTERIAQFIGDGADVLVLRAVAASLGLPSEEDARSTGAVDIFDRLYRRRLLSASRVYPGVAETLQRLTEAGLGICCITNKDGKFALPLLEAAGLRRWLAFTLSPATREERKPNPAMLIAAARRLGVQPAEMVYVGDTATDILAAHSAGCPAIAVSYGYNHKRPLAQFAPEAQIDGFADISRHLEPA
jgi:phosphoglycolate phosphatase